MQQNPEITNQSSVLGHIEYETELAENASQIFFCEICLENKEGWEMFINDKCPHSFCYECTTNHMISKIEEHVARINCPAPRCKAMLNSDICRILLPEDALTKWEELLCLSLIPEASKLYCPFRDCSATLVNDSGEIFQETFCYSCNRSFCVDCRVPWHAEFTCKEFKKLSTRKKDDNMVKNLAKKKKWKECPKCKILVERSEGCSRMTCRCKYEFCYKCGCRWANIHYNCEQKINRAGKIIIRMLDIFFCRFIPPM